MGLTTAKDPEKITIKSSKVFPPGFTVHQNDRVTGPGGGVFTAVKEGLIADAQPQLTTDCEIVWTNVIARNKKDIQLCSYDIPHLNLNNIARLDKSLKQATNQRKGNHIILAGDFNFTDINWEKMSVNKGAADCEVQWAHFKMSPLNTASLKCMTNQQETTICTTCSSPTTLQL